MALTVLQNHQVIGQQSSVSWPSICLPSWEIWCQSGSNGWVV